ncbi:MAG: hypothetical protein ACI9HK_002554 [Pirellulaceae bacterium]|jgi:hypothetical protein
MKPVVLILCLTVCVSLGCKRPTESLSTSESNNFTPNSQTADNTTTPTPAEISKTTEDSRLQRYFERYCDYTGGMGIGFVASHTYDFNFRQHLKKTDDEELKRLFVLQHLYRDVDSSLRDYEEGRIRIGKTEYGVLCTTPEKVHWELVKLFSDVIGIEFIRGDFPENDAWCRSQHVLKRRGKDHSTSRTFPKMARSGKVRTCLGR